MPTLQPITAPLSYFVNFRTVPLVDRGNGLLLSAYGVLRQMKLHDPKMAYRLVKDLGKLDAIMHDFEHAREDVARQDGVDDLLSMRMRGEDQAFTDAMKNGRRESWLVFDQHVVEMMQESVSVEIHPLTAAALAPNMDFINAAVFNELIPWLDAADFDSDEPTD